MLFHVCFSSGEWGGSAHQQCSDFELVNRLPTNMKVLPPKRRSWSFVVKVSCVEKVMRLCSETELCKIRLWIVL